MAATMRIFHETTPENGPQRGRVTVRAVAQWRSRSSGARIRVQSRGICNVNADDTERQRQIAEDERRTLRNELLGLSINEWPTDDTSRRPEGVQRPKEERPCARESRRSSRLTT